MVSPARNVPECEAALVPMALMDVLRGRTSSAKSAIAPTPKALNSVLNAKSSHVKPPSWDPSATVTASLFLANPEIVSFKFALANLAVIAYGFSRSCH